MRSLAHFALSIGVAMAVLAGCGGSQFPIGASRFARHHPGTSPIQHVVLIVQENRSFDNLFAHFPGANGATRGKAKEPKGSGYMDKWVRLKAHSLIMKTDLEHCHSAFENDYDGGKMDGFYLAGKGSCPSGKLAETLPYQYVEPSQIQPYWDIANQWVLADEMFQTQGSGSFTAHQDLIRGGTCIEACSSQSSPSANTESLIDNPSNFPWGCDAAGKYTYTWQINIYGSLTKGPFPCSDDFPNYRSSPGYETLRDLLDTADVSWKYYTPCFSTSQQPGCSPSSYCGGHIKADCAAGTLDAFDAIYPVRNGSEWGTKVSWPDTNIFTDIANDALPAVSWVIPEDDESDHPDDPLNSKHDYGPEWVASVVNAVGQSQYWSSSVVIVVWDDWGGFYDSAVPPFQDQYGGLGFRIPMLVISPYAIAGTSSQGGYVAHTQYEFGSILKYIEQNWNLGSLGTTDARATSIGNVFNYGQSPRAFSAIPSDRSRAFFINRPHPVQRGDPE
jgi:phospholipase C